MLFLKRVRVWDIPGFVRAFKLLMSFIPDSLLISIVIFFQKSLEKYEIELFKRYVKPGMTVLDIGANVGLYTVLASNLIGVKGRVYAFEPEPDNIRLLRKHVGAKALDNVIIVPKALSSLNGKLNLYKDGVNLGNHSISPGNLLVGNGCVSVESITLDKYFDSPRKRKRVGFIKIDTEGAEGEIFLGGKQLLRESRTKIMMEFCPEALKRVGSDPFKLLSNLLKNGYKIKLIDKSTRELVTIKPEELIDMCEARKDNTDYANLLLVRRP
jgi:FkbM family methyltransferase